jgi:AraC-like DNA-binding protein
MQSPLKAAYRPVDPPASVLAAPSQPATCSPGVHVVLCRAVLGYLQQQGADPSALYPAETLHRLQDTTASVPLDEWHALLDRAEAHLGDTDVALKAADFVEPWQGGVFGFALMTSPSISAVGDVLVRCQRLLTDAYQVRAHVDEQRFELRLEPSTDVASPRLAQLLVGTWASRARWLTGIATLRFDASFMGPAPHSLAACERSFGGRVAFEQPFTAMWGSAEYLALPVMQRDAHVNGLLCQQAAAEAQRLGGGSTDLLRRLRRQMHVRLGCGGLSLEELAADLDIAPRTLQVRLEAQGLTYRCVLDRVRESRARQYLAEERLSLTEIALATGFANQSAFQHAFKRWTGLTPGQWRRQCAETRS